MENVHSKQPAFLSKDVSAAVKGIAALMVLFHHFYQRTYFISQPLVGKAFELLGYLAVSIFFFFSGYGLLISYDSKKDTYIHQFPRKRLLPFYCTYLFFVVITLAERMIIGKLFSVWDIVKSLFLYGTVVTYGWYFQTILLFYILFFLVFRFVKKQEHRIAAISLLVLAYTLVYHMLDVAPALYVSSLSFLLGVFWCCFDGLRVKIMKNRVTTLLVSGAILLGLLCASLVTANRHFRYIPRIISSPFFVLVVLMMVSIIYEKCPRPLINKVTGWLGRNSLEIYFLQGVFFTLFRSDLLQISNSYIYIAVVFICTIVFAPLLHMAVEQINKRLK